MNRPEYLFSSEVNEQAVSEQRASFIRRTYLHLAAAVALFVGVEYFLINSPWVINTMLSVLNSGKYSWLLILGAFVVVGWMARSMARSLASPALQYLGLGLYILAEAVLFVPMIFVAAHYSTPDVLPTAAFLTTVLFGALTLFALTTRKDFSFMRGFLTIGGLLALGTIVAGTLFGFTLGLWFSVAMIVLAAGAILHDTSNIVLHYPTDQHVAASLELFASVALLFWYILRLVMALNRR